MQRTSLENDKKRHRLVEMFEELLQVIGTSDNTRQVEFFRDLLQKEQSSGDIIADCESNIKSLKEKECVILVAGACLSDQVFCAVLYATLHHIIL